MLHGTINNEWIKKLTNITTIFLFLIIDLIKTKMI